MHDIFLEMQKSQSFSYPSHDFNYSFRRKVPDFEIQAAIWTVVSDDDEVLFLVIEEEFSGPKKVFMFHRCKNDAFFSNFIFVLIVDLHHFKGILFI